MKPVEMKKVVSPRMSFSLSHDEEPTFHQKDLIRLRPFGLSFSGDAQRPLLLLRDESQQHTLPVPLSPLEAGATLPQDEAVASPHRFLSLLLESLGMTVRQAVFVQIDGAHQLVRIYFTGHPELHSLKLRADEAMSLCVQGDIPIFATREIIQRSRLLKADEGDAQAVRHTNYLM